MGVNRTGQPDLQTIFHFPITFHHMTTMDIFIYIYNNINIANVS